MGYLKNLETASPGTYAAMWPTVETQQQLIRYYKDKIPNLVNDFHITTTSSRKECPKLRSKALKISCDPKHYRYEKFGDNLVLVVNHAGLHSLWDFAMRQGASYNYESYIPHVTLSTDYQGSLEELPPVPLFPLYFDQYKVEDLKE